MAFEFIKNYFRKETKELARGKNVVSMQLSVKTTPKEERVPTDELEACYYLDAVCFNSINKATQMIMGATHEFVGSSKKKYIEFFNEIGLVGDDVTFEELLGNIFKYQMIYGDAYIELVYNSDGTRITDLFLIDPKKVDYARTSDKKIALDKYAKPIGYVIKVPYGYDISNSDEIPEEYKNKVSLGMDGIFILSEKIAHFKLYTYGDRFNGIGLIEPSYKSILYKMNIEKAQANNIFQSGVTDVKVGDDKHHPTPQSIDDAAKAYTQSKYDGFVFHPYWFEATRLELNNIDSVEATLKYLRRNQTASLGIPESLAVGSGESTNRACYSEDTKVLTKNGWKHYKDVGEDEIAVYDKDKDEIRFEKHDGLFEYDYDGEMINFTGKSEDILVTPDHRMLFRKNSPSRTDLNNNKEWVVDKAENIDTYYYSFKKNANWNTHGELTQSEVIIPKVVESGQGKHNELYSEDVHIDIGLFNEFLGYFLSEGGISHKGNSYTITFAQKEPKSEKIKECFNKMPFHFTEYFDEEGQIWRWSVSDKRLWIFIKQFGNYCYDKTIGNYLYNTLENSKILFDAMMLGDGTWDREEEKGNYYTTSKQMAEDFVALSMRVGYSANMSVGYIANGNRKTIYRISLIKDRTEITHTQKRIKRINYDGKVYCFSTSTGFFLTMRGGKVAIQGNTLNNQQAFFEFTLRDIVGRTISAFDKYILKRLQDVNKFGKDIKLQWGDISAEEPTETTERLALAVKHGILSPEEAAPIIRQIENIPQTSKSQINQNKRDIKNGADE